MSDNATRLWAQDPVMTEDGVEIKVGMAVFTPCQAGDPYEEVVAMVDDDGCVWTRYALAGRIGGFYSTADGARKHLEKSSHG